MLALGIASVAVTTASHADELVANRMYVAGTRVESSPLGLSFVVPAGWAAKFGQDAQNQVLVMGSNAVEGVGLAILQAGRTPEQIVASLDEAQDLGSGVVLQPTGRPLRQGTTIVARYQNDAFVGRAAALVGPSNNGVIFFFTGPNRHERTYVQLVDSLSRSTSFATGTAIAQLPAPTPPPSGAAGDGGPASQTWLDLLTGQALHYFSSYNSGGGGGGMASQRVLHLCSGGRFAYTGDSSLTMNVPGASASGGGRDSFRGQWRIESPTANSALLVLTGDNGRELRWQARYDGSKTFLNGQRWLREQSKACR
jgi:hypothetical protein